MKKKLRIRMGQMRFLGHIIKKRGLGVCNIRYIDEQRKPLSNVFKEFV